MGLKIGAWEACCSDLKFRSALSAISDYSYLVLAVVCHKLFNSLIIIAEVMEKVVLQYHKLLTLFPQKNQALKVVFIKCRRKDIALVIIFVSEMFAVDAKALTQNKPRLLSQEEITNRSRPNSPIQVHLLEILDIMW